MKRDVIQAAFLFMSMTFVILCLLLPLGTSSAATGKTEKARPISYAFNDSPEHKAIIKLFQDTGEKNILQTTHSVSMSKGSDFANAVVSYTQQEETAEVELFLFKENETWVAYRELPTRKNHSAIFTILARRQCKPRYKDLQGISLIDDTWKGSDTSKRSVNIVCSELINNEWDDHRLTFDYEYNDTKGWHITGERKTQQIATKTPQKKAAGKPPKKSRKVKAKPAAFSANVNEAMEKIFKHIGSNSEPVFIVFGTAGSDFIQYNYVTQSGSKDIQNVDWLNGKLRGPQASRLARPCHSFPLEEVNFDLVAQIFEETIKKAKPGDTVSVNVSRNSAKGCKEPEWQGVATSAKHVLTITYSIDGKQTDVQEFSF